MAKQQKAPVNDRVRVRILPLHNIGGVGFAGDTVWLSQDDANRYVAEGYVEILATDEAEPVVEVATDEAEPDAGDVMFPPERKRQ